MTFFAMVLMMWAGSSLAVPQAQLFVMPGAKHSLTDQPLALVHTALLNFLTAK